MTPLLIALFGVLGVFSRYGLSVFVTRAWPSPFPYGTFVINCLGSFLIGVVYVAGVERAQLPRALTAGIMVGFLGGFTTFSSYSLEAARLFEGRQTGLALVYWILSPIVGGALCWAAIELTRGWLPR